MRIILAALILVAGTAIAQPKKRPQAPPPPPPAAKEAAKELSAEDAAIALRFFNMFVDVILAAKGDCDAVAANVNMFATKNKELIRLMAEATAKGKQVPKPVMDKMMLRVKDLMSVIQKCGDDPAVEAALKRLDGKTKR